MTTNADRIADEARKANNEYQRKWRRENADRVREYNKKYWNKIALERLAKIDAQLVTVSYGSTHSKEA